jgi:enoyl-CoA hydratase/carnithine racemase
LAWPHHDASLEQAAPRQPKALTHLRLLAYAAIQRARHRRPPGEEAALLAESREEVGRLFGTPEAQEGVAAMIGKRRPRWER